MYKSIIIYLSISFILTLIPFARSEDIVNFLPDDSFSNLKVIHKIKFPYKDKTQTNVGYYYLYGDKFVDSQGIHLSASYFVSRQIGSKFGLFIINSSESEEVAEVQKLGVTPKAYGPSTMIRLSGLYRPIYGKLIIGNYIQRLLLGLEAGLNIAHEQYVVKKRRPFDTIKKGQLRIGPVIGVDLLLPISKKFDLGFNVHYFTHRRPLTDSDHRKSFWGNLISAGYRF